MVFVQLTVYAILMVIFSLAGFLLGTAFAIFRKKEQSKPPLYIAFVAFIALLAANFRPGAFPRTEATHIPIMVIELLALFIAPILGWICWSPKERGIRLPNGRVLRLWK